ncbi:hypothetical protein G4G27_17970 [Sphingomonas sp. So64.6b]|uniref:hypothetical protein n=1 Tax=Sphingomonas sp. So64.6b TaxID=2997354 RepID=UPI0016039C1A|nr:hypothetical protein [Sphingomonas sp. So64.6b]QNA85659.1 hypothetical protein G4G27_17970 [Sphingomonas sp. So64.6b]
MKMFGFDSPTLPALRQFKFAWLREVLQERAFSSGSREFTGKTAGKPTSPHGNFAARSRENREVAEAGVMVLDSGLLIQDGLLDSRPARFN